MRLNKALQLLNPRLKHYRTLPAQQTELKVLTPKLHEGWAKANTALSRRIARFYE